MNSALFSIAVSALLTTSPTTVGWQTDYAKARELGVTYQKPVFVVVGTGQPGHSSALRGDLADSSIQSLNAKYVLVFVDAATTDGRKLAGDLGVSGNSGVVISDRTGELQAFRHSGVMDAFVFGRVIERYSDKDFTVRTTENESAVIPAAQIPTYVQPAASQCLT